ncbi:MAG: WG repeat-containing protein [Clostridiales bacterium]|nr:WG repeat-containing protein [Clostridiales bacterium]
MKKRIALLLILILFASLNAQAQTIALQTDPPLYLVESTPDFWEYYYDLVDADGNVVQERWADSVYEKNGVLRIEQNGLIGVMDYDGSWIVEPQFTEVRSFFEGMAVAKAKELYGYIDESYSWALPPTFQGACKFSEGLAAVEQDGLWGYIDKQGDFVIEPKFAEAGSFSGGYAVVWDGDLCEIIDKEGKFVCVCPPKYVSVFDRYGDGHVKIREEGFSGLLFFTSDDEDALEIDCRVLDLSEYDFYEVISSEDSKAYVQVGKDGLYGLLDMQGNPVLDVKYKGIYYVKDDCAAVTYEDVDENAWFGSGEAKNSVIINFRGEPLSDEVFDDVFFCDDDTIMVEKDGKRRTFKVENDRMIEVEVVKAALNITEYAPFEGKKNAAGAVREDIGFDAAHALPRLDGATALFPVYAAFAQAVYPEDMRYTPYNRTNYRDTEYDEFADSLLTCSKTDRAYERLIYGNTDVIFCAQPSDEELQMAKEAGVTFELTPIGYEAFVFIVPREEPVTGLTTQNIRDIYRGAVTDWVELGIEGLGKIVAYQRPENSGSQTALEKIMGDLPLMDAPGYVVDDMVGIVDNVEYRNLPGAIGYSFRYFVSGMMESDVRMLAIDGVEPTLENIRNGSYPFISTLYAVTRRGEANPNVQTLLSWLTGDTAQRLLEASGYVGLN